VLRVVGLCACVLAAGAAYRAREPSDAMRRAAREFAHALSAEQRSKASFDFDDAERRDWHFVPRSRRGVALGELSETQRELAWSLLRTALSDVGVHEVDGVITLESVLREVESNPGRDAARYFVTLFGDLDGSGRFGWRLEGHHLSLNFADTGGAPTFSCTPQFFGANPATVRGGTHDGLRVLAREEDLARALVTSLDETQRKAAIVEGAAPADITLGPGRDSLPQNREGIRYAELGVEQQAALRDLIELYVGRLVAGAAEEERARWLASSDDLRFVWIGGLEPGQGHYYRIQGPRFAIEYDNTQNGANHVHTLWRDFERDFGDPLREHREREHK
jgi:hypothetical protein